MSPWGVRLECLLGKGSRRKRPSDETALLLLPNGNRVHQARPAGIRLEPASYRAQTEARTSGGIVIGLRLSPVAPPRGEGNGGSLLPLAGVTSHCPSGPSRRTDDPALSTTCSTSGRGSFSGPTANRPTAGHATAGPYPGSLMPGGAPAASSTPNRETTRPGPPSPGPEAGDSSAGSAKGPSGPAT